MSLLINSVLLIRVYLEILLIVPLYGGFMKKLLFAVVFTCSFVKAGKYSEELDSFKERKDTALIFKKYANLKLKNIVRDINTARTLSYKDRFLRRIFTQNGVLVTKESMPHLYNYIENLCDDADIEIPVVFISQNKSMFNAFASKLFTSSGGVLIGQELINECSDEEIEAVVAHEIGHIKHNHINKALALNILVLIMYFYYDSLNKNKVYYANANDQEVVNLQIKLTNDFSKAYFKVFGLVTVVPALVIGKRFEREADNFACKAGKAEGLIKFFTRLQDKVEAKDKDFKDVKVLLSSSKDDLSLYDYVNLYCRYYIAEAGHTVNKGIYWFYHNTPFGPHPSNQDRIAAAKKYLKYNSKAA